ncbi:EAL domain-containing protein [Pseudoalteromonas lipolytica]|uniref:EAL domain-containing protein n=2 Tax=Pseudoalteromonas TaxID=53246 RepID=UPI0030AFE895
MPKRFLFVFLFVFSALIPTALAQNYALQIQRISTDEGLTQGSVTKIVQDDLGFIWIGTYQGLNRYDGYKVSSFAGEYILDQRQITFLAKTQNGKIFVSTEFSGAFFIDPKTLKVEKIYSGKLNPEDPYFSPILAITEDDNFYYFAISQHVYSYNKQSKKFLHEFSINKEEHIVRALTIYDSFLYIGTSTGLFSKNLADDHVSHIPLTEKKNITEDNRNVKLLHVDPQLGLLVGTVEGMYDIPFNANRLLAFEKVNLLIPQLNIWDYSASSFGEYIVTEKGLYEFNRESLAIDFILSFDQSKFLMTDNTIPDVMVDKTGLLWLASRSQGVFTWSTLARRFKHIELKTPQYSYNNNVWTVLQEDDVVWIGTDNGLIKYNQNNKELTPYLVSNDEKAFHGEHGIYGIAKAELNGNNRFLWLMKYIGLGLFDKQTGKLVQLNGDPETIEALTKTPNWGFHTMGPDQFAFVDEENFYKYNGKSGELSPIKGLKEQLEAANTYTFLKPLSTHPDEYLISMSSKLFRYNESTQKLTLVYEATNFNPLAFATIHDWVIDYNNILWLASSDEGLIGIDADTYEIKHRINRQSGLKAKSVFGLQIDRFGFLWMSTQNGLYRLDLSSLALDSYFIRDGLAVNEFNFDADTTFDNGEIAFGSTRGVLIAAPEDFLSSAVEIGNITTEITDVSLLSRELNYHPYKYVNSPLQITSEDMGLGVSFSNFDTINKDKTLYKVTLDGPTSLQYDKLKTNEVFFTKLPPGDYVLSISSSSEISEAISATRQLRFNVAHAPWTSPIAKTSYGVIIFTILLIIFWQYRARQQAISRAHVEVLKSQQQTELALSSNKSGVWEINLANDILYTNRFSAELGYNEFKDRIAIKDFIALIHPHDRNYVINKWQLFLKEANKQQWNITYRLKHNNGDWLWYEDVGRVVETNETGGPLKVAGFYTNITEQRANAQQASVLGEAFSQINDWLLILDNTLMPFSANASFSEAFATPANIADLTTRDFINAIGRTKYFEYVSILKTLKPKQNWKTEAFIRTLKNASHPVHISVTAVAKDSQTINYYVIVISDLTEQKRAEDELRYLANYDSLTGLPNRTLMYAKINSSINRAKKHNKLAALLFIDLDKFKPVNDSFGHAVGDQLLCNVTQRVKQILPQSALVGRQSGDEFLVLVKDLQSPQALSELVKKLTKELANKVIIDDFSINISASIGVALYPFDAKTADDLIRNSDIAMMHAKQSGRNNFKYFTEQMNNQLTKKLLLENALKDAFKDDVLFNNYQPIVNANTKTINGAELLMRWKTVQGYVSPAEFIPIAEEIGLIDLMTEQALDRALTELKPILRANPKFYLSLNLSPTHILKSNLTERLLMILNNHLVKPIQLRLEITENTLLEDKDKASKQLQKLKNAGFKLLLDDFGTGYSSLTYLNQFPIDVIKIDQSFVRNIGSDNSNESIIKTIHALSVNLGLYCIAEGVETLEQINFLRNMGCDDLQGYYFAKPMEAEDLIKESTIQTIVDRLNEL